MLGLGIPFRGYVRLYHVAASEMQYKLYSCLVRGNRVLLHVHVHCCSVDRMKHRGWVTLISPRSVCRSLKGGFFLIKPAPPRGDPDRHLGVVVSANKMISKAVNTFQRGG